MTTPIAPLLSSGALASSAAFPAAVILLKITGLLLIALAATLTMARASAGARHLVWLVALGALLLLPPLAVWAPLPIRVLPELPALAADGPLVDAAASTRTDRSVARPTTGGSSTTAAEAGGTPIVSMESWSVATLMLGLWALVGLGLIGRLGYGVWSVRRIVRRARPLAAPEWQAPLYEIADRLGLEAAPVLLRSDDVRMPFAAGLLASTIVLPAESDGWSAERRSAVLIHELGHVRRRDLIGHTLSRIVCALYWFHPLVWTAARRLRAESERACDDLALNFGARPSDYAEHLLEIVTCVRDHNTPAVALAMAHRKEFEGRMLAILNPELRRRSPSRLESLSLVGSLALLALVVGAAAPVPRSAPLPPSPTSVIRTALAVMGDTAATLSVPAAPATPQPYPKPEPSPAPAPVPRPSARPRRVAAITAEPDSGDTRAEALAKALRTDGSGEVRRVAAWGLHRYAQTDAALEALTSAVVNDADAKVREMAVWALAGARRRSDAGAAIVKVLQKEKDAEVRATAAWAAGEIGDEAAVPLLIGFLKDSDPELREMAAWSIGACHPDKAPAGLSALLSDSERDVRESAVWALYTIRDESTADAIDAAFRHETDGDVREGMIRALGHMGDRSIGALQRLVASPDSQVRAVAITALAGGNATGPWPWPRPQPRPFP